MCGSPPVGNGGNRISPSSKSNWQRSAMERVLASAWGSSPKWALHLIGSVQVVVPRSQFIGVRLPQQSEGAHGGQHVVARTVLRRQVVGIGGGGQRDTQAASQTSENGGGAEVIGVVRGDLQNEVAAVDFAVLRDNPLGGGIAGTVEADKPVAMAVEHVNREKRFTGMAALAGGSACVAGGVRASGDVRVVGE